MEIPAPARAAFNFRKVGDVTVIDVAGQLKLGEAADSLRDAIRNLVAKDQRKILVNLSEVTYIDSCGLGELVGGFTTVKNKGGQLKLLNLTQRVKDLLQLTRVHKLFEVYENESHAVRSFSPTEGTVL